MEMCCCFFFPFVYLFAFFFHHSKMLFNYLHLLELKCHLGNKQNQHRANIDVKMWSHLSKWEECRMVFQQKHVLLKHWNENFESRFRKDLEWHHCEGAPSHIKDNLFKVDCSQTPREVRLYLSVFCFLFFACCAITWLLYQFSAAWPSKIQNNIYIEKIKIFITEYRICSAKRVRHAWG